MVIGIDMGISSTKIVGIRDVDVSENDNGKVNVDGLVVASPNAAAADPVSRLYGVLERFLYDNGIGLADVSQVMLTGVGSGYIDKPVYGIPTGKVDEFLADGCGASFLAGIDHFITVSMGTGTSLVLCDGDDIRHIGGIGIGGGTLQGLARVALQTDDVGLLQALAAKGDIGKINVLVGDVSAQALQGLPKDATASLFGSAGCDAKREDIALGLIHMVLQSIGSASVLSALNSDVKDFVLIGQLTLLEECRVVFPKLERLYGVRFHIPRYSEFCTAIGAALQFMQH